MGTQTTNVITLSNSIIGVGILAMPYCFLKCRRTRYTRQCLAQNAAYMNIFGENLVYLEIADDLRELLQISISPLDNWPKKLCINCLSQIQEFRAL
ncbi:hypothetical protein DMENIID0001_087250 [Sergentomyia squamirostris]